MTLLENPHLKMIVLEIFDTDGQELKIGDLVMIRNGSYTALYSRVQFFKGYLAPFYQFAYDQIFKVNELPVGCVRSPATDLDPEYWYHHNVEKVAREHEAEWRMDELHFRNTRFYRLKEI